MTSSELTWLPIEPSADDLAFMEQLEENQQRIINAFALPPSVIGVVDHAGSIDSSELLIAFLKKALYEH